MNAFRDDVFSQLRANRSSNSIDVLAELAFERAIAASRKLAVFRRNAATWELLLLLALSEGDDETGIYELIGRVESRALGNSALLKFLREQTDAGMLQLLSGRAKRSRRVLRLEPTIVEELVKLLHRRNRLISSHPGL
ncbi:MAG: hypothetical protein HLUCCA12_18095 [Rhodobacteraceae bacterium HLUCCA12]|nr:MAG: hypothetical protein HLUCCA12_18095 [Rhodobacteraceae bacterium HLUCCA12]